MTPGSSFFLLFFESEPLSLSRGVSGAVVRAEGRGWGQGRERRGAQIVETEWRSRRGCLSRSEWSTSPSISDSSERSL